MFIPARKASAFALILTGAGAAAPVQAQDHGQDIVETAIAAGSFNTLAAALQAAGLVETLQGDGPFTVFAPTDEAFSKLPDGTVESLLRPENRDALIGVLTYHVVAGRVAAEQVVELDRATTVNGADVRIRASNNGVRVNDANVVTTDVFASNGVIHVIDQVLLPPEPMQERGERMSARERSQTREATEILMLAIERGVPLFNHGSPEATAAIYEVASRALLAGDFDLPMPARRALEDGLRRGGYTHDMSERAWDYRRGVDRALDALEERMMGLRDRH